MLIRPGVNDLRDIITHSASLIVTDLHHLTSHHNDSLWEYIGDLSSVAAWLDAMQSAIRTAAPTSEEAKDGPSGPGMDAWRDRTCGDTMPRIHHYEAGVKTAPTP